MAIVHISLLKFKSNADPNAIQKVLNAMLDLKTNCVLPSSGEPYILNSTAGRNTSPEGLNDGLTHALVTIFASEDDRAYYLEHDPARKQFSSTAVEVLERVVVVDYEPSAV